VNDREASLLGESIDKGNDTMPGKTQCLKKLRQFNTHHENARGRFHINFPDRSAVENKG
jgi:hypothetical protein